jgi:ATP-dependent RNA helicase DHX57
LILLGATLDASVFEDYFKSDGKVGRIEISGRTFPVEDYYLDDVIRMTGFNAGRGGKEFDDEGLADMDADMNTAIQSIGTRINYDLITQTVKEIDEELSHTSQDGGILIFLPGVVEISKTLDHLRSIPKLHVLPLHASLQSSEQRRVFPHAPIGKRKVIVATNIAETSITIDDIVAVIDTGRVKETSYDPQNNMRKLEEVWASRAACKQVCFSDEPRACLATYQISGVVVQEEFELESVTSFTLAARRCRKWQRDQSLRSGEYHLSSCASLYALWALRMSQCSCRAR